MKKILLGAIGALFFIQCTPKKQDSVKENTQNEVEVSFQSFGDSVVANHAIGKEEMLQKFQSMNAADTLYATFKTTIREVCQKKGCWMTLDLGNEAESFVKFKDYGFFVPKNAQNHEVIVSGKAFVNELSVDEQKHYAQDSGASKAEIDSITQPMKKFMFIADGVLIANK